jgi:prophage regulatory protein
MHANKERGRPNRIVITKECDHESHLLSSSRTGDGFADLKRVLEQTSLSRSTIYREIAGGRFPRPHRLSLGRVGWLRSEVEAWMAARAAGGHL